MKSLLSILIPVFILPQWSCQPSATGGDKLLSQDTFPLIPKSDTSENEKNNGLIAFVGEKIDVQPLPQEEGSMDGAFRAKYKILDRVYGYYSKDTIEFTAYDHYGWPAFSLYKHVLLFVSEYKGKYYHQKYQFFDVYKSKNGRWASPYKSGDYNHPYNKNTTVKPEVIEFNEKVVYPVRIKEPDGTEYTISYDTPFFETRNDSAYAVYGNFLEDLFALKRHGVLKARGLFETTIEQEEAMIQDIPLEEITAPPDADDLKFMAFWKVFAASVKEPGLIRFKRTALDSLWICDTLISTGTFIEKCFSEVIDQEVMKRTGDSSGIEYTWTEASFPGLPSNARKEIMSMRGIYRFRQALVTRSRNNSPPVIRFIFIETKKGYRLYGIDHQWFKKCCQ